LTGRIEWPGRRQ